MREVVDVVILSHFDTHGVATAAARARILGLQELKVKILSKFPETGPQGLSTGDILKLVENYAVKKFEVIDIPLDVRNPEASIDTLVRLTRVAPVFYYDHHVTDLPYLTQLQTNGVFATVLGNALDLAVALNLFADGVAEKLAILGAVADRDSNVLRFVSAEEIESNYLPLANKLDIVVRKPELINVSTPGDVAHKLVEEGIDAIPENLEYPPEVYAKELQVVEKGDLAVLIDWSKATPAQSMWVPKTLEQLLLSTKKYIAIAVVPGINPKTRITEGYDVRVLKYWLAPADVPLPEQVVKEEASELALEGRVVGHADYVSLRFPTLEEAEKFARTVYKRIEGLEPKVTHLISEKYVSNAVRRDFRTLIDYLEDIKRKLKQ